MHGRLINVNLKFIGVCRTFFFMHPKFGNNVWISEKTSQKWRHIKTVCLHSGNFFYRKPTIGATIVAIEANNDTYCFQKRIEKLPLDTYYFLNNHLRMLVFLCRADSVQKRETVWGFYSSSQNIRRKHG